MFRPDDLLTRLVERAETRYFGKYRGHVQDNNDPKSLGRIKASVPQVLGDLDTGWAVPAEAKQPDVKVIKTKSGHVIVLDDAGNKLQLTDSNGNTLIMDQSGVSIQDLTGNSIKMETSG